MDWIEPSSISIAITALNVGACYAWIDRRQQLARQIAMGGWIAAAVLHTVDLTTAAVAISAVAGLVALAAGFAKVRWAHQHANDKR